jgi:hypothetical protein
MYLPQPSIAFPNTEPNRAETCRPGNSYLFTLQSVFRKIKEPALRIGPYFHNACREHFWQYNNDIMLRFGSSGHI